MRDDDVRRLPLNPRWSAMQFRHSHEAELPPPPRARPSRLAYARHHLRLCEAKHSA